MGVQDGRLSVPGEVGRCPFSCRISVHSKDPERVYGKEICLIYLRTEELWAIFPC